MQDGQISEKIDGQHHVFHHPKTPKMFCRLGVVACSCNPATWRRRLVDGLRSGSLPGVVLCRSGVRAKPGINMVSSGELDVSRLSKEGRNRPRAETQQAKVSVLGSSRIAPVNRQRSAARPTTVGPNLLNSVFISFFKQPRLRGLILFCFAYAKYCFLIKNSFTYNTRDRTRDESDGKRGAAMRSWITTTGSSQKVRKC